MKIFKLSFILGLLIFNNLFASLSEDFLYNGSFFYYFGDSYEAFKIFDEYLILPNRIMNNKNDRTNYYEIRLARFCCAYNLGYKGIVDSEKFFIINLMEEKEIFGDLLQRYPDSFWHIANEIACNLKD